MKRWISCAVCTVFLLLPVPLQSRAAELLIPVGRIIALQLRTDTVVVAAYDDALGTAARDAGVKIGDELLQVNGKSITCAEDVRDAIYGGANVSLTLRRGSRVSNVSVTPVQTEDGPRLGVYLRQGIAGIGTVTFYDPDTGRFGTLGHGVSDARGGLLQMTSGSVYEAEILSVKKGKSGDPGQLKGTAAEETFGAIQRNTPQGVFGITKWGWRGEPLPVAQYEEISQGQAKIRCQVCEAGVQEYSVEILKIYPESRADGRNFLIRVTDPNLLEITGGIVQGMSGSLIIQDGKLVGAVTHVLVNDPTRGYGIFIENMLDAAK